jgi:hypothetical protein
MTDMDHFLKTEVLDEVREIIGVRVHVVAGPRLARPPVAAAIMRDAAIFAAQGWDLPAAAARGSCLIGSAMGSLR